MSQKAEYCAEGISQHVDNPDLQDLKYDDFFERWRKTLVRGKIISGKISGFPKSEENFLELQDIKAILIIPIINEDEFIGFIGFDNCISEDEWNEIEITFLQAAANDISQFILRQRYSLQLQTESIRFQTTLDAMDAMVYVADMDTYELLFMNKLCKKLLDDGDGIGKKCYAVLQKEHTKVCEFCTNHLLLDKSGNPTEPYVWEFQNTVTKRWYQCRDQAIRWTDGRIVRMEIAVDITERKKAEEKLRISEYKYRSN